MSYLTLPAGIPDFTKGVISLWFRLPQETINKVKDESPVVFYDLSRTIVPLIMFGRKQVYRKMVPVHGPVAYFVNGPLVGAGKYDYRIVDYALEAEYPIPPCYIGIDCEDGVPTLTFSLQMADLAGYDVDLAEAQIYSEFETPYPPAGWNPSPGTGWSTTGGRISFSVRLGDFTAKHLNGWPELFLVESPHQLAAEHWHHLLLSFDFTLPCNTQGAGNRNVAQGTTSASHLWYAIDDVNYKGSENLGPYFVVGGADENAVLTQNAWKMTQGGVRLLSNLYAGPPICNYQPTGIPSASGIIGIPAVAEYVDHIYKVEMAELQIFTGIALDTGVVANRRAFVDAEGKPVPPATTETLLGKRPDVLLHRSTNWKQGRNTGSRGLTLDGDIIPSGQFTRQGVINQYKPDPSLHGPQSPAVTAGPVQLTRTAAHAGL